MTGHTHILCVSRFTEVAERKLECYCIVDHIDTSRLRLFILGGQFSTILKFSASKSKMTCVFTSSQIIASEMAFIESQLNATQCI